MGQTQATPKSLILSHFPKVKEQALSMSLGIKKGKLDTFCSVEWPSFGVGWPAQGSLSLDLIGKIKAIISRPGPEGHPDQLPYILVWENLAENPPSWLEPFLVEKPHTDPQKTSVLVAQEKSKPSDRRARNPVRPSAPPVLPDSSPLYPLPPIEQPPPYAEERGEAAGGIENAAREPSGNQAAAASPDSSAEGGGRPERASSHSPALAPRWAPGRTGGMQLRSRGAREQEGEAPSSTSEGAVPVLPVRAIGTGIAQQYQYWPFSSSDLYNWRTQNPPFSEDPKCLIGLVESIMFTHRPTWDDCQQLLRTLFTTEERERILNEARKNVLGENGRPTTLQPIIDEAFPLMRPDWDFGTAEGRERLRVYRQTLMTGLQAAARRPTNLAKVKTIVQGEMESPAAYLERLFDAYRQYTPINLEAEEHR